MSSAQRKKRFRQGCRNLVTRSRLLSSRKFSSDVGEAAKVQSSDSAFVEAWRKIVPNVEPPKTPLSFMQFLVRRRPPPYHRSLLSMSGGAGGALRDSAATVVVTYALPLYHYTSALKAETQVLIHEVEYALQAGYSTFQIETDAQQLVSAISLDEEDSLLRLFH